jgi:8-oxo-dGTP pyrophosphatase MutT (NUDIX family)
VTRAPQPPSQPEKPVRDAATVLLVDDHQSGWRVYMVKRHHKNAFMANAHVFVGGRVDDEDSSAEIATRVTRPSAGMLAERLGLPAAQKARALGLYVAAIREAFEECGLLLAKRRDGQWIGNDNGDQRLLNQAREALNSATLSFAELLVEHDLWLDLQAMRYLAHWITPPWEPKLYDTRFFVARAPAGQCARFDPKETTEGQWTRPAVRGVRREPVETRDDGSEMPRNRSQTRPHRSRGGFETGSFKSASTAMVPPISVTRL